MGVRHHFGHRHFYMAIVILPMAVVILPMAVVISPGHCCLAHRPHLAIVILPAVLALP